MPEFDEECCPNCLIQEPSEFTLLELDYEASTVEAIYVCPKCGYKFTEAELEEIYKVPT